MRIFVVDDDNLNLAVVRSMLNEFLPDAEVVLCKNPVEAVGIIETDDFDILLLDIVMPKVSGIDILKYVRSIKKYEDMQVIMLTAMTDNDSFQQCFELGADDFIRKPINITEFMARVKSAVKERESTLNLKIKSARIEEQNNQLILLNKELNDTQFYIIQKEKMASIGELAAGVAHEINNPIGFVGSNLETMKNYTDKLKKVVIAYKAFITENESNCKEEFLKKGLEELLELEKQQKLDIVMEDLDQLIEDSNSGIERVIKIVQSLTSFARTGLEDEVGSNGINHIIEEALMMVRNEAKYIADIFTVLEDVPNIMCNKVQITQVIVNLLVNSIQAIKSQERESRGKISISTHLKDGHVFCEISDDGPGIPVEIRDRVFDPFFTTKEVGKGTGLGLSISYDIIVKKHNGIFYFTDNNGTGTTFCIGLPL